MKPDYQRGGVTLGRKPSDNPANEGPVYMRVSEVWHLAGQGIDERKIARVLFIDVQDVRDILRDARAYQLAKGVEPKCIKTIESLPIGMELAIRKAQARAMSLAKKAARTVGRKSGEVSDREPVSPVKRRRRGW